MSFISKWCYVSHSTGLITVGCGRLLDGRWIISRGRRPIELLYKKIHVCNLACQNQSMDRYLRVQDLKQEKINIIARSSLCKSA